MEIVGVVIGMFGLIVCGILLAWKSRAEARLEEIRDILKELRDELR